MAKAIEAGIPKLRIEEAAARTQARIDSGHQKIIGVNWFKPTDERPHRHPEGRQRVGAHASRSRSSGACARARTKPTCDAALAALSKARRRANGNLLDLAVKAARAKATVGEISDALEKVWGRHRAEIKAISGVYKREVGHVAISRWSRSARLVEEFERATTAAARASSSPRWARTGTTAARR